MKVESLSPVNNHPHILCRFNLVFPNGITIRDITLMTGQKGKWINWPSRAYKDKDGKDKHFRYIDIDKDHKEKIESEIKAQIDKILTPHQESYPQTDVPF